MSTQATAITQAKKLIGFAQQLQALRHQVTEFLAEYGSENYGATWAALATAPLNPDGTPGAADPTPNPAHSITAGGLNVTSNALVAGVTLLQDFQKFLTNQPVTTAQRSQSIDDLVG